jgi:hypothetical protein
LNALSEKRDAVGEEKQETINLTDVQSFLGRTFIPSPNSGTCLNVRSGLLALLSSLLPGHIAALVAFSSQIAQGVYLGSI